MLINNIVKWQWKVDPKNVRYIYKSHFSFASILSIIWNKPGISYVLSISYSKVVIICKRTGFLERSDPGQDKLVLIMTMIATVILRPAGHQAFPSNQVYLDICNMYMAGDFFFPAYVQQYKHNN